MHGWNECLADRHKPTATSQDNAKRGSLEIISGNFQWMSLGTYKTGCSKDHKYEWSGISKKKNAKGRTSLEAHFSIVRNKGSLLAFSYGVRAFIFGVKFAVRGTHSHQSACSCGPFAFL